MTLGTPEDISMTRVPGRSRGRVCAMTSATWSLVGSIVTMASASAAASSGLAADPPTSAANAAARPGSASTAVTSNPARTRLAAIGQPMLPTPTKAIRRMGAAPI